MPRRFTRTYTPEFRAEAIRLVREGHVPISDAARDLGISGDSIRLWTSRQTSARKDGLSATHRFSAEFTGLGEAKEGLAAFLEKRRPN